MKQYQNLPVAIFGAGLMGLFLRFWLFAAGTDERGLLVPGHLAEILLWLLTAGVALVLVVKTRHLVKAPKYSFNYPASVPGAIGVGFGAAGILLQSVSEFSGGDFLQALTGIVGILSAAGIGYVALCRWKGRPVSVIFHALACVYLMLHLVCLYRLWHGSTQLADYGFRLFAVVSLMLSLYHRACFDAGMGKRRPLVFFHLAAVYFCLTAIYGSGSWLFYLFSALWMVTDLCSLTPVAEVRKKG